jgi:hypothetical protein
MRAGVLGVVDGSFDAVGSVAETVTEADHELDRCLTVDRVFSLPTGEMAFAGRAAADELRTETEVAIEGGDIAVSEETLPRTAYTEFVGVTGEFVAVGSGDGAFAFDLIADETGTEISRATLDLDAFYGAQTDATPWKAGFVGGEGGLDGVYYGEDLRENLDLDAVLADARLNQLGLSHEADGDRVKMTAARSGYVEVYRPSTYEAGEYLAYVRDAVLPHVE